MACKILKFVSHSCPRNKQVAGGPLSIPKAPAVFSVTTLHAMSVGFSDCWKDEVRRDRALSQRIYLLEELAQTSPNTKAWSILGSTDTVYTVTLERSSTRGIAKLGWDCSCPDFENRCSPCKHVYFVVFRVLGVTEDDSSERVWEVAGQVRSLSSMPFPPTNDLPEQPTTGVEDRQGCGIVLRKEWKNEDCVICYEPMTKIDKTVWCTRSCGNSFHSACFVRWRHHAKANRCVLCRALNSTVAG